MHEDGLEASVRANIQDRTGKIKGALFLTKSLIGTYQKQGKGAMAAARTLWEGAIVLFRFLKVLPRGCLELSQLA